MEFEKLQMIIAEVLSISPEDVKPEMSFVDDLGADSLEIFQIIMGIEDSFDVVIDEAVVESVETVEQVLLLVSGRQDG